ncbi:MAG TPA: hypothetical protein VG937_36470 [Polyangiaceae bacterium]|jgi:hypothetical protein|nr:hypothetical protein [Polyangiaceae bacterium]
MKLARATFAGACFAVSIGSAVHARAEESDWKLGERTTSPVRGEVVPRDKFHEHDGVYGRFDGDLTLSIGLGAELHDGPRGALLGRALYYHTGGLTLSYADALGGDVTPRRVASASIELRPLFLPRWSLDLECGCPLVDLTLDSLALGAGVFVARRGEPSESKAGLELSVGLGIPLFAKAEGLWLEGRGFFRPALDEGRGGVLVALSLYESVITPLID